MLCAFAITLIESYYPCVTPTLNLLSHQSLVESEEVHVKIPSALRHNRELLLNLDKIVTTHSSDADYFFNSTVLSILDNAMLPTELVQLLHNHVSVNGSAERGVFHNPELFIIEGGYRQDYDNTHRLI